MKRSDIHKFVICQQSRNDVKVRGEILSPILWQGEQWAVTTYGLECRDGTYHVSSGDFWNLCGLNKKSDAQDVFVSWWKHLSGKSWCDEDDVDAALQAMLVLFNKDGTRTNVQAPTLMDEFSIEEYALQAGNLAYENAKLAAMGGVQS